MLDRGFRTSEQVKTILNTDCIALIPRVGKNLKTSGTNWLSYAGATQKLLSYAAAPLPFGLKSLVGSSASPIVVEDGSRGRSRIIWAAVDAPNSAYADAIRSMKLSLDSEPDAGHSVIGLTSYLPTEGKSTIAAGIAGQKAQGCRRVVLIDCDLRNPSLSRALTPEAEFGLLEVIAGEANLAQAMRRDPGTKMAFLPMVTKKTLRNRIELLTSPQAKQLIASLKGIYDYVIIDTAPLISNVDVLAVSRFIESYVMVIEWGATKMESVRYALGNAPTVQMKMVGAVLNKVDYTSLARYEPYGAYHRYGYGRTSSPPPANRSSSTLSH
jgi:succinoglycan biosynthesis transport protein ExoP